MTVTIHRLLDEAFAGIEVTAEVLDLKEEMRANLLVRVAELERSGLPGDTAAQRAIQELGDIRSVIDETRASGHQTPLWTLQQVRLRPAYLVRAVVSATVAAVLLAVLVISLFGDAVSRPWRVAAVVAIAILGGTMVADGLCQETTTNYPIPRRRAFGYGVAAALALAGAGCASLAVPGQPLPWLAVGGLAVAASIVGFTYLGATQTNRHKPWAVRIHAQHEEMADRFSQDPAAAARFGLYTVAIWLVAVAGFVVLGFTVGWAWSWLALLAGLVATMITLARTLFAAYQPGVNANQPG